MTTVEQPPATEQCALAGCAERAEIYCDHCARWYCQDHGRHPEH